jgi:hypothetical protein
VVIIKSEKTCAPSGSLCLGLSLEPFTTKNTKEHKDADHYRKALVNLRVLCGSRFQQNEKRAA